MEDGLESRLTAAHDPRRRCAPPPPTGCASGSGRRAAKATPAAARRAAPTTCSRRSSPTPRSSRPSPTSASSCATSSTTLRLERAAAAPTPAAAPARQPTRCTTRSPRARARTRPRPRTSASCRSRRRSCRMLMQRIDISVASALGPDELRNQIAEIVEEIIVDLKIQLNASELRSIVRLLVDDMIGLGPLEPLLEDDGITDIMVNGPQQVYVERKRQARADRRHLPRQRRIVLQHRAPHRHRGRPPRRRGEPAGRRPPADGSRVNIIIPPLAIDGAVDLDPQVPKTRDHPRPDGAAGQHLRRHGDGAADRRALPAQHPDLGRHRLGQDDAAERAVAA